MSNWSARLELGGLARGSQRHPEPVEHDPVERLEGIGAAVGFDGSGPITGPLATFPSCLANRGSAARLWEDGRTLA